MKLLIEIKTGSDRAAEILKGIARAPRTGSPGIFEINAEDLDQVEDALEKAGIDPTVFSWYSLIIDDIQNDLPTVQSDVELLSDHYAGLHETTEQDAKEAIKGKVDEWIRDLEKVKKTLL